MAQSSIRSRPSFASPLASARNRARVYIHTCAIRVRRAIDDVIRAESSCVRSREPNSERVNPVRVSGEVSHVTFRIAPRVAREVMLTAQPHSRDALPRDRRFVPRSRSTVARRRLHANEFKAEGSRERLRKSRFSRSLKRFFERKWI